VRVRGVTEDPSTEARRQLVESMRWDNKMRGVVPGGVILLVVLLGYVWSSRFDGTTLLAVRLAIVAVTLGASLGIWLLVRRVRSG
jgi:hypothetical protein